MLEHNFQTALHELKDLGEALKEKSLLLQDCIQHEEMIQKRIEDKEKQLQSIQDLDAQMRMTLQGSQEILKKIQEEHTLFQNEYMLWFQSKEDSFDNIEQQHTLMSQKQEDKWQTFIHQFQEAFEIYKNQNTSLRKDIDHSKELLMLLHSSKLHVEKNIEDMKQKMQEQIKVHEVNYKVIADELCATEDKLKKQQQISVLIASSALIFSILRFFV
jgi:chromosome segregation ATPase